MIEGKRRNADELIAFVMQADYILRQERDLSPRNSLINETLSNLVWHVQQTYSLEEQSYILQHPDVQHIKAGLLSKLSKAETEMEFYYARQFVDEPYLTVKHLEQFIYWEHYSLLLETELEGASKSQISLELPIEESVAFVGAGPFPISAILLHLRTGLNITCVDCDEDAYNLSRKLIKKLDLDKSVKVVLAKGEYYNYVNHPIVFVASLVGTKEDVMKTVFETRKDAVCAVRTVEGVRTLLYEPVDELNMRNLGYTLIGRTHANEQIINSTLFYTKEKLELI